MDRLAAWYRHIDQELLRREVRWTLRWMTRGWGGLWMAALTICQLGIAYASFGIEGMGLFGIWLAWLSTPLFLANFGIIIYLIHKRSLRLFDAGSLRHLYMSSLGPRDLWPALLAAPLLFAAATTVIQMTLSIPVTLNMFAAMRSGALGLPGPTRAGAGSATVTLPNAMEMYSTGYMLAMSALGILSMLVIRPALMAFTAWRCFPRRESSTKVFLWYAFGWLLCHAPPVAAQIAGTLLMTAYSASAGGFPGFFTVFIKYSQIVGTGVTLLLALAMLWISLWQLRKPWQWDRLRIETERWR